MTPGPENCSALLPDIQGILKSESGRDAGCQAQGSAEDDVQFGVRSHQRGRGCSAQYLGIGTEERALLYFVVEGLVGALGDFRLTLQALELQKVLGH